MGFSPDNTPLKNPDQPVKTSAVTRQQLLDGIDAFFAEYGFTRTSVSEAAAPYVQAYGVVLHDDKRGYGLRVEAAPTACGTGIVFDAVAYLNMGEGWKAPAHLSYVEIIGPGNAQQHHRAPATRWSTSEKLVALGMRVGCDRRYIESLKSMFLYKLGYKKTRRERTKAAAAMRTRLGADTEGYLHGADFTGRITSPEAGPKVTLKIETFDADKAAAILALLRA
jgi:hypothetical protein